MKRDPIHKSKRVIAAVISVIVAILVARGIDAPVEDLEAVGAAILAVVAGLLDIYSKYREGK